MNIEQQKEVATELLHKLEALDPACILAGGSPRDWFMNKTCNDLDFYVYFPNSVNWMEELRFKRAGLDIKKLKRKGKLPEEYACMEHLKNIYEGEYKGMKYQVMVMNQPTFKSVVPMMGVSICKTWWKGDEVNTTLDFLLSLELSSLYKKDNYTAKELHVTKMQERFPKFTTKGYKRFDADFTYYCKRKDIFPSEYKVEKLLHNKWSEHFESLKNGDK